MSGPVALAADTANKAVLRRRRHIGPIDQMIDVVSTAELHGIYIDTTSGVISTLYKNNDIETIS